MVRIRRSRLDVAQALTLLTQDDFFTIEEEIELSPPPPPSADLGAQALQNLPSTHGLSFSLSSAPPRSRAMSTTSLTSGFSSDTFLNHDPNQPDPTISLRTVLDVIKRHRSLQEARIIRVDSYQNSAIPYHRFIILQLEREGREQIWLRIDRRRDKTWSLLNFALNAGTSPANDRVSRCRRVYI